MSHYKEADSKDINAVIFGLNELERQRSRLKAERDAQLHELVLHTRFSLNSQEEALRELSKIRAIPRINADSIEERVLLCRKFILEFDDNRVWKKDIYQPSHQTASVAVLNNPYVDIAFEHFSRLKELTSLSVQSFNEICETVNNGGAEYGIIPIESSDSGKLLRFYSLINQYDLKINAVCDIAGKDGSTTTRYALIGKSIELSESPEYFEFSINLDKGQSLNEILLASSLCSMTLHRIDSIPISYREMEYSFYPIFKIKDADIDTFLLYMYLDFPQYTPIGIFPKL